MRKGVETKRFFHTFFFFEKPSIYAGLRWVVKNLYRESPIMSDDKADALAIAERVFFSPSFSCNFLFCQIITINNDTK